MDDFHLPTNGLKEKNHERTIVHIDIDCFYAQIEIIKNPTLRDKPVGIQQKNIVVTSNYIARKYGIKKCMLMSEAKRLCPELVTVNGEDLYDYRQMSSKISVLLQNFSPLVEKLGLDENFIDVTEVVANRINSLDTQNIRPVGNVYGSRGNECSCGCYWRLCVGTEVAEEMRSMIQNEVGITSCAGIATNKLLSKLICATHKPNQQTVIFPSGALVFMSSLPNVTLIPGIGNCMGETLNSLNIKSVADLQMCELNILSKEFGLDSAVRLKNLSLGTDHTQVKQTGKPQTIGIEDGCRKISLESEVQDKFFVLLQRLMKLISDDKRIPLTIRVTIRKYDSAQKLSSRESKQCPISPTLFTRNFGGKLSKESMDVIMAMIMKLFHQIVDKTKSFHVTLLGLAFTKFQERVNGKASITSYLMNNVSVQSVLNYTNEPEVDTKDSLKFSPTFSSIQCSSVDRSGSETEAEPSPKKTRMDSRVFFKRKRCKSAEDISPSKLRVSQLCLNSDDFEEMETNSSSQICSLPQRFNNGSYNITKEHCPSGIDKDVFLELPYDIQVELINSWKKENFQQPVNTSSHFAQAKSGQNSILKYFISNN